jgi:hypothetical protein
VSAARELAVREEQASIGQRMLWLIDRHRGHQGALNYPTLFRLRGPLDVAALQRALDALVARHETLRTTFTRRRGLLTQVINEPRETAMSVVDLSTAADSEASLQRHVAEELSTRIDPRTWPHRVTLWRLRDRDHVLCLNAHHMVTDASSCGVLLDDLARLLGGAGPADLPRVGWQYRHFGLWQRRQLSGDGLRAQQDYWRERLAGLQFPPLPPRTGADGAPRTVTMRAEIDPTVVDRLRRLARDQQTTPFVVMLSVLCALLHGRSGQTDVAVASLCANRMRPELARTVGFFANMVVLRTRFSSAATVSELVRAAHGTVSEALLHQQLPYYLLPADVVTAGSHRADDFVFQMLPDIPPPTRVGDLEVEVLLPEVASRFDLELALVPRGGRLTVLLQCAEQRVDRQWAAQLVSEYASLAARFAGSAHGPLGRLVS